MDDGSNVSLITFDFAKKLDLKSVKVKVWIVLASQEPKEVDTELYTLKLISNDGVSKKVKLLGVPSITSRPEPTNVEAAYEFFPFLEP